MVLSGRNLVVDYTEGSHSVHALKGVSIDASPGEVVALQGASGSGKTTLLSVLGCLLTPCAGDLALCGRSVVGLSARELARVRRELVGFVFQQYNLFAALTARENVEYSLNLRGRRGKEARSEAERVLDIVGLRDRQDFLPRELSGGQKQRVAIARALAGRPPLLLADEPSANLDGDAAMRTMTLLRSMAREGGHSVVIATHDERLRAISDRVLRLQDGRLCDAMP
jgi:putative ABC transport system ATP-binding protein